MVAPTAVSKAKLAVNSLRKAEESALDSSDSGAGNGGFYTGSGKDGASGKARNVKKIKRRATIGLIIALMIGGGTFLGTSNSLLVGAFDNVAEAIDTQYAPANKRMPYLVRRGIQKNVTKDAEKLGYGKVSKNFEKRLAKSNITYTGKGKNTIVTFTQNVTKSNGEVETVTKNYKSDEFVDALKKDNALYEAFQTARRGRVATFFDNNANIVLNKRLKQPRNVWNDYERTSDSEKDTKKFRETMTTRTNGGDATADSVHKVAETEKDADGNEVVKKDADGKPIYKTDSNDIDIENGRTNVADANIKAKNMIASVGNKVTSVGNFACTVPRVISMISLMIAAQQIYQSISYFMPMIEPVSKTKAGEGNTSPINEFLNFMSTEATTETTKFGKIQITENENTEGKAETVKQTGSPLQANGLQMMLAGAAMSAGTTSLFSLERANRFAWSTTTETEETCMVGDSVTAVVSIGVTIATFGASSIASEIFGFVASAALGEILQLALGFLVPTIAQVFFTNVFESAKGIPGGELFALGAAAALTRLGRNGSGQSLSSKKAALAANKLNQEVLAQDAEIDRRNLSPFDINNKNTFIGSIAYGLLPITMNSSVTNLSSLLSITGESLGNIINTNVKADGENTSYATSFGDCPSLKKIGAVGDVYCNPITTTDVDTIDMDPDDGDYLDEIMKVVSCDDEGCTINDDSDLAKYIAFCAGRDSPFGNVDQNILSNLQSSNKLGSFRGIVGAVPLVGDAADLIDTAQNAINMPWATGEICGNTEENSEFWGEQGKYYQRYVEDMRLLDQMGAFEDHPNPVIAFEEKYEAEHPTDDSYVGYMSRISGLLPENVETALAFIDYFQYLEEYDPSVRIAMTDHPSTVETSVSVIARAEKDNKHFTDEQPQTIKHLFAIFQHPIIYADIRNRSFAA